MIGACNSYVEERIERIMAGIKDLEDALKLETKCSAGDKYETGRAMLHLEFEKLSAQLEEYRRLKKTLSFINASSASKEVSFGSVVKTSHANYFIAIPAGEQELEEVKYFAVGANSPIARAMAGKRAGEDFYFNGKTSHILSVI